MINFRNHPAMTEVVIPNGINLVNNKFNAQFYNMQNLVISEFNHPDVTGMFRTYDNCRNLTGAPVCGDNVIDMYETYYNCTNLTGSPVCGNNVVNMASTYRNCYNLTGAPVCGNNVTRMSNTYYNCRNLTGAPVCGKSVVDMAFTYQNCTNLTGSPVCGNNVTSMIYAYQNCYNLTGAPACGKSVVNMSDAYEGCSNLAGPPVCGNNVTNMRYAYSNCYNLTGSSACGNNVTNMHRAYYNCMNLSAGNHYWYSSNISYALQCFHGKNNSRRYNIYVPANSTTLNTCLINNGFSLFGTMVAWTNAGSYYYNTSRNTYIYPVANVAAAYEANENNNLITFTIAGTEYQAEEGMTWEEWCDSDYNTGGYYTNNRFVCFPDGSNVTASGTGMLNKTSSIVAGYAYYKLDNGSN